MSFSQIKDTLSLKILNIELSNNNSLSLNVEIVNNTNKFVVLPVDSKNLCGYEFGITSKEPIFSNLFDENRIKFGVRFYNSSDNLISQGPSESYNRPNEEEMYFDSLKEKSNVIYRKNLMNYYKKKGVIKNLEWLLFLNYVKSNIRIISPKKSIHLSYLVQLNDNNNNFGEINKFYFKSDDNPNKFQIELFIQKNMQEYLKQIDLTFIPKNESFIIYYGKLKSNKVPIKN